MLKFYAQTESDSEYESNTEEELDEVQDTNTAGGASRYLQGRSDSDDVNDLRKRVVQTAKEKRFKLMVHTAEPDEACDEHQ
ncbi:hypothetical protein DY000_02056576 [Brassica cretica]|uniref:Uncharacterized protein n=1 Tax=Brassica cretica TaxID=69181 RepID=A0ABQ7AEB5_BRACR|nr:hypothetical protein DY000_02056576 [Brassica cretica]